MSRVPIRVRVAAAFAVAMALVLAGTGLFLYARLGDDLAAALDQDLRLRASDLSALVRDPNGSLAGEAHGALVERGESFAELVTPHGVVLDSTPPLGHTSLLGPADLRAAVRRAAFVDRRSVPGLDEGARLLATRVVREGRRLVLVVGATRENRAEALRSLRTELLIAGPIALLLAIGIGYLLAGSGLRAVETMRRRAATVSADRPGERLPIPRTGDELERLGETLNAMLDRLEAALERERGFVAEAGHELRTPLALLRAELDFALHHAETPEERSEALRTASDETDRLVQLAGDLLLIASADQDQLALRTEPMPAADVLASVRNRFGWRAAAARRALVVDAPRRARAGRRPPASRAGAVEPRRERATTRRGHGHAARRRPRGGGGTAGQRRGSRLPGRRPPAGLPALQPRVREPHDGRRRARARDRRHDRPRA